MNFRDRADTGGFQIAAQDKHATLGVKANTRFTGA
jgi:hypothetical protein